MEEIEYLEEYEDFILPNGANRTEKLGLDRTSVDSLEGLYKDLIGESPTPPADTPVQYTAEPVPSADLTDFNTMDVGLLGKPIQAIKSNVDSGSTGHIAKTNPPEIKHLYKAPPANIFINRVPSKSFSTGPGLQRTDKLKSVATVKPTLQRIHNTVKQSISNNSPPFKNATVVHSFHPYPHVPAGASTEARNTMGSKGSFNSSKTNQQNKSSIKTPNPYQGTGVDPLSLDDHDAFLDFDVDKHGLVDDFDFESDLDNSITAGISDMDSDSVDLSDDYSDGNFDLMESDLSSDASDVKRSVSQKKKKLQKSNSEASTNKIKVKPGASSNKLDNKIDQMNLSKGKRPQQIKSDKNHQYFGPKTIEPEKRANNSSFEEIKIHETAKKPQILGTKDSSIKPLTVTTTHKEGLFTSKLSMLSKLLNNPNDFLEKMPSVITIPKPAAIAPTPKKIVVVKKDEWSKNQSGKPGPATTKSSNNTEKRESIKPHVETETANSTEAPSADVTKKTPPEPKLSKSSLFPPRPSTEPSNHKDAETPDKSNRTKFGSFYLNSIKPPANKVLIVNKIPPKLSSPPGVKKPVENGQNKEIISLQKLSPEKAAPTEEESRAPSHDSIADVPKKDLSHKKSLTTVDEDRSVQKSKTTEDANSCNKLKRISLKQNNHSDSLKKKLSNVAVEKHATPSQNNLKETNETVQSPKCLTEKVFDSAAKESNSLKENVPKPKENKAKSKESVGVNGVPRLQRPFKPRAFNIRLNKNAVARLVQSSTGCTKSNEPSTAKAPEQVSENALKRKMTLSPSANTSFDNLVSEVVQDKPSASPEDPLPESEEICKKSRLSSDVPSRLSENHTETQRSNAESPDKNSNKKLRKSREKNKKKRGRPPKNLRSRSKSTHQRSDTLDPTSSESPVKKSTAAEDKEGNVQKSPAISTEVTNQNKSPAGDTNASSNEIPKVKRKVGRPRKIRKLSVPPDEPNVVSQDITPALPVLATPANESTCNGEQEPTVIQPAPLVTDDCMSSEDPAQPSSQPTNLNENPEIGMIEPKEEVYGDTLIIQYQPDSSNMNTLVESIRNHGKTNTLNNIQISAVSQESNDDPSTSTVKPATNGSESRTETEVTVFELPSYIVMKTKLITRKELNASSTFIPPLVKQKIDKLAEEREAVPVVKTERPDFKDVCVEINALLDKNANYLKFASGSERQARMNQVLADSSLTVDDAQCTLKFLQSYLSLRTKDITLRSKSQQFIPIYDSQKKIIGYRKRRMHPRKCQSNDSIRRSLANTSSTASTPSVVPRSNILNVSSLDGTSPDDETLPFTTKKEPQAMDAGDEEIIVPDAPPSTEPCIKNEVESSKDIT